MGLIRTLRNWAGVTSAVAPVLFLFPLFIFSAWFIVATLQLLGLLLAWCLPVSLPWLLLWALIRHRRRRRPTSPSPIYGTLHRSDAVTVEAQAETISRRPYGS